MGDSAEDTRVVWVKRWLDFWTFGRVRVVPFHVARDPEMAATKLLKFLIPVFNLVVEPIRLSSA